MDGVPQTTFIPRKPVSPVRETSSSSSLSGRILLFSIIIFIIAALACGSIFAYQRFLLVPNLAKAQSALNSQLTQFDPGFITELSGLSNRLAVANTVLDQHAAVSQLFAFLASETITSVQFNNFSYTVTGGQATISMAGQAGSFAALDAQENEFDQISQSGSGAILSDPIISGIGLTKTGAITFTLTAAVPVSALSYKTEIDGPAAAAATAPASSPAGSTDSTGDANSGTTPPNQNQ